MLRVPLEFPRSPHPAVPLANLGPLSDGGRRVHGVTGSASFNPRRKQWTVILRQVPRSVLMAPGRVLHDDTGNGENGQGPIFTVLEAKGTPNEAHGGLFCSLDGPAELALEGLNIKELCVVNGAD